MNARQRRSTTQLQFITRHLVLVTFAACSSQPPVVATPPDDIRAATLNDPWLSDERAMMRNPNADLSGADPHSGEEFNGPLEDAPQRSLADGLMDVVGFPFRGIGWLLQAIL